MSSTLISADFEYHEGKKMKHRAGLVPEHVKCRDLEQIPAETVKQSDLKTKQYRIHQTRWQNSLQIVCKNKRLSTAIFLSDLKGNIRVVHSRISRPRLHRTVCISLDSSPDCHESSCTDPLTLHGTCETGQSGYPISLLLPSQSSLVSRFLAVSDP